MLTRLTDRVFYLPNDDSTDRPLLGLVTGDRCSLVVDSGNSPAHAGEFLRHVAGMNVPPPRYLAITHWHWDHVFGISTMNLTTITSHQTGAHLRLMQQMK